MPEIHKHNFNSKIKSFISNFTFKNILLILVSMVVSSLTYSLLKFPTKTEKTLKHFVKDFKTSTLRNANFEEIQEIFREATEKDENLSKKIQKHSCEFNSAAINFFNERMLLIDSKKPQILDIRVYYSDEDATKMEKIKTLFIINKNQTDNEGRLSKLCKPYAIENIRKFLEKKNLLSKFKLKNNISLAPNHTSMLHEEDFLNARLPKSGSLQIFYMEFKNSLL